MNEKELRLVIFKNGETAKDLAIFLGMSEQTLSAKIRGIQDFWRHEVISIRDHYHLTSEEMDRIFFASEVSCQCTQNPEGGTEVNKESEV